MPENIQGEPVMKIEPLRRTHYEELVRIGARAYPTLAGQAIEDLERLEKRVSEDTPDPRVTLYGCFQDDTITGIFRLYDYQMNVRSVVTSACGLGGVAVDMAHKRKGIARRMVEYYLDLCVEHGYLMALLWPFRPDFYRCLGFGYGAKTQRYRWDASSFPDSDLRTNVRRIRKDDVPTLLGCYNSYASRRNGMVIETRAGFEKYFRPSSVSQIYGYEADGRLTGYVRFKFGEKIGSSFLAYDLHVDELIYHDREALAGLLGFLNAQQDQVRTVELVTSDESLHFAVHDPRDDSDELFPSVCHPTNTDGVGIMFRAVHLRALFHHLENADFGTDERTVRLEIVDDLVEANSDPLTVRFENGSVRIDDSAKADVTLSLKMEHFSSLLMGAVSAIRLYEYGLLESSDTTQLPVVDRIFGAVEPPMCTTPF
jgi:predicted acetyltransferase